MKTKKAQQQIDNPIVAVIVLIFVFVLLGVIYQMFACQECQTCEDCTPYKEQITNLTQNLSDCLNRTTEIIYVNQTIEKEIPVEVPVYRERVVSSVIISISFILSLVLTITLFKIKLPKKIEEELEKYEKIIKWFKIGSVVLSALIFIRLIWIFVSLF